MDRSQIEKVAKTPEDRLLLSKLYDKIQAGMRRNIQANTCFLSPREQELAQFLFGSQPELHLFGGYPEAERKMLVWLPEYLDAENLTGAESPLVCLRAVFYQQDTLTHRDFLGALMGAGIARETVGDILVDQGSCDFFVTREIAPYVLGELREAGRTKLRVEKIDCSQLRVPQVQTRQIRDTLASLRLDSLVASGFRMSRGAAAEHITAGRVSVDGVPCEKPDRILTEGVRISLRGMGKLKLTTVNGQTKKGRISVILDRYV